MTAKIFQVLMELVEHLGYGGIWAATALEYACFPISSELLLPFIGYTVAMGGMGLFPTILTSTAGGVCGSLLCYAIGRFGKRIIKKIGVLKFSGLREGVRIAGAKFDKYGKQSVFIARMFPIARTYISIPAGMRGMDLREFCAYTAAGAFLWNTMLISAGYFLGEHWDSVKAVMGKYNFFIYIGLGILAAHLILRKTRKHAGLRG